MPHKHSIAKPSAVAATVTTSPELPSTTPVAPPAAVDSAWKAETVDSRPSWIRKIHHFRYTPQQMRGMRAAAIAPTMRGFVDHPPFQRIPRALVPLLSLRHFHEFVELDYDWHELGDEVAATPAAGAGLPVVAAPKSTPPSMHPRHEKRSPLQQPHSHKGRSPPLQHAQVGAGQQHRRSPMHQHHSPPLESEDGAATGRHSPAPLLMPPTVLERLRAHEMFLPQNDPATNFYCVQCASHMEPCDAMRTIIESIKARERKTALGAFFLQSPDVVSYSLLIMQVFEGKRTSMRMRGLKEKCPRAVSLVKEYLCGPGFHISPPPITAHEKWTVLLDRVKFTWIRDNRTRIFTELSRNWKRTHSPFEQFMHFFFYRTAVPFHRTKGMMLHREKPVIIACLAGDIEAVVLLCELRFVVPSDLVWDRLPYFKECLDPKLYCVLRHLCVHYFRAQLQP